MSIAEPLQPDLARELLVRAEQAADYWARRVRDELDAIDLGQSRRADHVNAKILTRVLADHGWPGHRLVGPDACRAAWRLALHADDQPDLQRTAARLLHRAAQAGDASIQHWAHLQDRALINSRIPQEFGTQYRPGPHGVEPYPTRAPDALAARRESVGLPSPAAALEALRGRLSATPNHGTDDDTVLLTVLTGAA